MEQVEALGIECPLGLRLSRGLRCGRRHSATTSPYRSTGPQRLTIAESATDWATDRLSRVSAVTSIHRFSARGFEVDRKARVEVLADGSVIGASQWVVVPAGASIQVDMALTAVPGTYAVRQATNFGSNIHENIVTADLESFIHPAEDAPQDGT